MGLENKIPEGWIDTDIGSSTILSTGFPFKSEDYSYTGNLRVVRGENISLKKLRWDNCKYWNHSTENLKQYFLQTDDIVVGMDGSRIGKNKSSVSISDLPLILAQRVARIRASDGVSQQFLKYLILNKKFERYIIKIQTGTSIPHISLSQIKDFKIVLPPLLEQKSIANILAAFDNKIELLQAQNKTLETMAQTIFKEWFGKYQIGDQLPEGWRVGKLGDFKAKIADFVANGSFASLKENVTLFNHLEHALFIRNTDLKSDFKEKTYVDKKAYEFLSKTKLFGGEIIISNVGDVGSVHLCPHFKIPMTLGNNIIMLKSEHNFFFYTLFKSRIGQHLISTITGGSAQPKFNKTDFRNMGLIIPPNDLLNNFEFASSKFYEKILKNKEQILSLTKTRDTLLPKLMSGQVRVNNLKQTADA